MNTCRIAALTIKCAEVGSVDLYTTMVDDRVSMVLTPLDRGS